MRRTVLINSCSVVILLAAISSTWAGEKEEMRKVEQKYEVVAWGKKQDLIDNLKRTYDSWSSSGTDWSVYERRYKELEFHWEEMKRKGIDPKKERVYFDYIDWVKKRGIYSNHYVKFYIAARKRGGQKHNPLQKYVAYFENRNDKNKAQQWELYDLGRHQHAIQNVRDRECLLDYAEQGKDYRVALFKQAEADLANRAQRWLFLNPKTKNVVADVKEGEYIIQNVRSRKVLDYSDGKVALLDMTERKTNRAQIWRLNKVGKRTFVIRNLRLEREKKPAALDYKHG